MHYPSCSLLLPDSPATQGWTHRKYRAMSKSTGKLLENKPILPHPKAGVCCLIPKSAAQCHWCPAAPGAGQGRGSPGTRRVGHLYAEAIVGGRTVLLPAGDQGEYAAVLQARQQLQVSGLLGKGGSESQGRTSLARPRANNLMRASTSAHTLSASPSSLPSTGCNHCVK